MNGMLEEVQDFTERSSDNECEIASSDDERVNTKEARPWRFGQIFDIIRNRGRFGKNDQLLKKNIINDLEMHQTPTKLRLTRATDPSPKPE